MGKRDYYLAGDHNAICDRCGQKYKAHECQMEEWHNLFVCQYCWEPRQPQDYVRGVEDIQQVPIARIRGALDFITTDVIPEDL